MRVCQQLARRYAAGLQAHHAWRPCRAVSTAASPPQRPLPRFTHRDDKQGMEYFVDIGDDGLLQHPVEEFIEPETNASKSALTPLARELHSQIKVRGPLSVSDYMYQCMQNTNYGYYMSKPTVIDSADSGGDFITSPEISQLFGELIGVWLVDTYQKLGSPPSFHLVEMGPGKGTLVSDVLRTMKRFPKVYNSLSLHLVETSPIMRKKQQQKLNVTLSNSESPFYDSSNKATNVTFDSASINTGHPVSGYTNDRVRVTWHDSLVSVPKTQPLLALAHEFFDALSVYQFQYSKERGWCEIIVDGDYSSNAPHHFRFALTPGPSPAARAFMGRKVGKDGDRVELQAAAMTVMEELSQRIGQQNGAALIIDYGFVDRAKEQIPSLTLQAVQSHQFVHPFHEPGLTDLTTLVDFESLDKCVDRSALMLQLPVIALPVITQSTFLRNLHIAARLEKLIDAIPEHAENRQSMIENILSAAVRLVDEKQMGALFKVMTIVNESIATNISGWWESPEIDAKLQHRREQRATFGKLHEMTERRLN